MPVSSLNVSPRSRRFGVSTAGLIGALAIHALFVLPFVLDLSLPSRKPPDRSGAGASALAGASEREITVVFINESSPPSVTPPPVLEALSSRGLASLDLPVVVLSPDASPAAEADRTVVQETTDSSAVAPDPAQHALLYGRYVGQVQARIDRAWMRPRTEIGAPRFSCRARIKQDRRGNVIDVTLDQCNGTERWQQSLASAIRTASPLPAPPDPSVYADVLWFSFSSEAFQPGGSTQGFEPDARTASSAAGPSALESFEKFVNGGRGNEPQSGNKEDSQVIHLTIVGSPAVPSAQSQLPIEPATPSTPEPQTTELPLQ
jgi:hypothetical protein